MYEFDQFQTDDLSPHIQKRQLDLHLDEPRTDRNDPNDILSFQKGNEFHYPNPACIAREILSNHVSIVVYESTFSVGRRVINQFRSALKLDIVDVLV